MTRVVEVPTRWRAVPGLDRESGVLVVGVGASDLDLRSIGLHHLVEHLVMRRVGPMPFAVNAVSSPESVMFHATGSRAQVVGFLRAVASAIRSLHRGPSAWALAQEQQVLATEQAGRPAGFAGPWTARFGCAGPGLTELPELGAGGATVEEVRAFVSTWFVARNARVAVTFDPDGPLGVHLPEGIEGARRVWRAGSRSRRPVFCETDTGALTVSFDAEQVPGDVLVYRVLVQALLRELRDEYAAIYSVTTAMCASGPGRRTWLVGLDPLPENVDAVVDAILWVCETLAGGGCDELLLEDARMLTLAELSDPGEQVDRFVNELVDELRGEDRVDLSTTRRAVEQMTADRVRDRIGELLATVLVTTPGGIALDHGTLGRLTGFGLRRRDLIATDRRPATEIRQEMLARTPGTRPLRPTRGYYPRVFGPVRGVHLWIGPGQFTLIPRDGPALRVDARDVVLAERDPDGTVALLTRQGGRIAVNPRHFRGAARWWTHFWDQLDDRVVHLPEPGH